MANTQARPKSSLSGLEAQEQRGKLGNKHFPIQLLKLLTWPISGGHTHLPIPQWQSPSTNIAGSSTHLLRLPPVDHSSRLLQHWGRSGCGEGGAEWVLWCLSAVATGSARKEQRGQ